MKPVRAHASPAFRKEDTLASLPHGLEDELRHRIRIVQNDAPESYVDGGWTGVEECLEIRGRGVVRGQVEKVEPGNEYVRAPVFWFRYQGQRPAVGVRDFETLEHPGGPDQTYGIQTETLLAKSVDDIT
jgi:hypothetical protein